VLVSDHPWKPAISDEFARRGLERADAITFISMARAGRGRRSARAARRHQGRERESIRCAASCGSRRRLNAPDAIANEGPERGTVWIEERLITSLDAPVGSKLRLGSGTFEVAAVITLEPERSANFFNIAPRLIMNIADVQATQLVQTGSRVWYYLYAAGTREAIAAFEPWAKQQLERGQRVENLENGRPEVRASIDRAQRFLGLTALLAAILAGVAVALATRRFVERHLDGCAVMRCLGATQPRLLALYGSEFLLLGIGACAVGCAIGVAAQEGLAQVLGEVLRADLPPPSLLPAVQGFLVGLVLLLGFAVPPLVQLKNVPAVRVIRRESGAPKGGAIAAYAVGLATLAGLLVWQAGDVQLGLYVVGGFFAAVVGFAIVAWLGLRLVASAPLARRIGARNLALRYGLANLRRHSRGNAIQVASLALGLTAVLLLTFTRNDLVDAWRRSAPPDAPNRFLLGVQPEQLAPVKQFFTAHKIEVPDLYPMVRGRLTGVNGRKVSEVDFSEERARRLVEREFNLSFTESPPAHNSISAGKWFTPDAREISVEEGIAKTLGWSLGDELTFSVGSESFSARVTSFRKLRWDSMKVNFFVIAPPKVLGDSRRATSARSACRRATRSGCSSCRRSIPT
jgi:putative ABC transport system permease protein